MTVEKTIEFDIKYEIENEENSTTIRKKVEVDVDADDISSAVKKGEFDTGELEDILKAIEKKLGRDK
jgi:hypothetical protein